MKIGMQISAGCDSTNKQKISTIKDAMKVAIAKERVNNIITL